MRPLVVGELDRQGLMEDAAGSVAVGDPVGVLADVRGVAP